MTVTYQFNRQILKENKIVGDTPDLVRAITYGAIS